MSLAVLLVVALLGPLLSWWLTMAGSRYSAALAALLPTGLFVCFLSFLSGVTGGAAVSEMVSWAPSLGVALDLRLDGFALLFALLITGVGALVTVYASSYYAEAQAQTRARFLLLVQLFMAAMLGTVLSDNLISMFLFWEWTSLMSFLLIGFERHRQQARAAAWQSLLITAGGGLALFAGILLLGLDLGTFSIAEIVSRPADVAAAPHLASIIPLLLLGAFTKSAQAPFHFWLPRAMAAPTPASAFLHSATMVKLGIYLVGRMAGAFELVPAYSSVLVVTGLVTAVIASVNLLRSRELKELLAHSTVASLGLLVLLAGVGGEAGMLALVVFLLAHALYKAALFFVAGGVISATGETRLDRLRGLGSGLPLTAAAALVAALSMAGIPPLFGFLAKEQLLESLLSSASGWLAVAGVVLVSAVLVAAAYLVGIRPFLRSAVSTPWRVTRESRGMAWPPLALALAGALLGVTAGWPAGGLIGAAASSLAGGTVTADMSLWHGFTAALGLSALALTAGAVLSWRWHAIAARASGWQVPVVLTAERWYHMTLDGILALAGWSTRLLQNGDQRRYTLTVLLAVLGMCAFAFYQGGAFQLPADLGEPSLIAVGLLVLVVVGSAAASGSLSLVAALIGVGVVGYSSALLFLSHGAPDLALTQFAVETLVLVVLMAVLLRLPVQVASTRSRGERRVDAMLALAFAVLVFTALVGMMSTEFSPHLSAFFAQNSYPEALGRNVVNVIIVDFRSLDTLGEIAVVGFATLAVWVLLRRRRRSSRDGRS